MQNHFNRHYFMLFKLIITLVIHIYVIVFRMESPSETTALTILCMALFLFEVIFFELKLEDIHNYASVALITEAITACILIFYFHGAFGILLPIVILDSIVLFGVQPMYYVLVYLGFFVVKELYWANYFVVASFLLMIYFQHYYIVKRNCRLLEESEKSEESLKKDMSVADVRYRKELDKNRLYFEHKMLEEKAHLSQDLHDKLGHSINGSVYQLEACKLMLREDFNQSEVMIQGVIDTLRKSMDEIRMILRRERPDKKQLSLLQLNGLCEECRSKYNINTSLNISGNSNDISEKYWEIILDNCYEVVSNALKYANCHNLKIEIIVMNKLIRCTIVDDGRGCEEIKEGMGLSGMRKRVREVKGFLDVTTDGGFTINMLLPHEISQGE